MKLLYNIRKPASKSNVVLLSLLSLMSGPVQAVQEALRMEASNDDTCAHVCLNRGNIFCGRTDFAAGYCCSAIDGCDQTILDEAPLCSNSVEDPLLKYAVCPRVTNCGQKVYKANSSGAVEISINPFETFMEDGDMCSYLLSVDEYQVGDMIELSAIDSLKMNLALFHGGYSLSSATNKTPIENGKRYLIDGMDKLFLMVETEQSSEFGNPYFSLQIKKVPNGATGSVSADPEIMAELQDESILSSIVLASPLSEEREVFEEQVTTVEIYTTKTIEREVTKENMETVDVVLLSIMWVCLGIALALAISIFIVISCRRVLVRSLKVQHEAVKDNFQCPTETGGLETQTDRCEGPNEEKQNKFWQEQFEGKEQKESYFSIKMDAEDMNEQKSRNFHKAHGTKILSTANRQIMQMETEFDVPQEVNDSQDLEGINAFNTEDALKQSVNPTHAVHPSIFGSETNRYDLNSSRTLVERKQSQTPGEFKFSTPHGRGNSQNKENAFSSGKDVSPIMLDKAKNFALMATIDAASNYDETKAAISSQMDKTAEVVATKKANLTTSSLEIEDPNTSGTENRRQKRRKAKRAANEAAPRPGTASSKTIQQNGSKDIFSNGELI